MNPVRDKNLESSGSPSANVSNGMKRILVVMIMVFAFFGIANSAYIAQNEASGDPLICNVQYLSGCNIVASSQYSSFFGIPISQYGVLFYGILFVLAAVELVIFNRMLRRAIQAVSVLGLIASLYFTFLQILLIGAFCIYCIASAVIALLIFASASIIEPIRRNKNHSSPPPQSHDTLQSVLPKKSIQMPPAT
jgi:uncharacterized membrane protein